MPEASRSPCSQCPFHDGRHGAVLLDELAAKQIPCHMTCDKKYDEDGFPFYTRTENALPCVSAAHWNERFGENK